MKILIWLDEYPHDSLVIYKILTPGEKLITPKHLAF